MTQTFGELLRHLRRKSGMTQEGLANRLGYSRSMIAALETDRRLPQVDEIHVNFAQALDLHDSRDQVERLVELLLVARPSLARTPQRTAPLTQRSANLPAESDPYRVPQLPTLLYGREREIQSLADQFLYHEVRLFTLVGPPGVGKSSLALATAERLQRYLCDGACFVSLASVTDADVVPFAILDALGRQSHAGSAEATLVAYLRHKEMLLLLDNFEQILDAAPLVAKLLNECPGVRCLVTSRERLHLRAEHLLQVQPLAIADASRLFIVRACAVNSSLHPHEFNPAVTEAICHRLDCLPLAIELCASQSDIALPDAILARLQSRALDLLVDGSVDLPPRQRTLRATIETSYEMLNDWERQLLHAVALFAGGCTQAMVAEVWTEETVASIQTERMLRALAGKSLARLQTTDWGDQRVVMLESVREFALGKLAESGDLETMQTRHFHAVSRALRLHERSMWNPNGALYVKRILIEQENLFIALRWAQEREQWSELASLLLVLSGAFDFSPRQREFYRWYHVLLPHVDALTPDAALTLKVALCYRAYDVSLQVWRDAFLCEFEQLSSRCSNSVIRSNAMLHGVDLGVPYVDPLVAFREAIALAHEGATDELYIQTHGYGVSRDLVLSLAHFMYGCNLYSLGEIAESEAQILESLRIRSAGPGYSMICWNLGYMARIAQSKGNLIEAVALAESSVEHAVANGNIKGTATWRGFHGYMLLCTGNLAKARSVLEKAWVECSLFADPFTAQICAIFMGDLALQEGNWGLARAWIAESMSLSARSSRDLPWRHVHRTMLAAQLAAHECRDKRAAQLYGFMYSFGRCFRVGPIGPVIDTAAPTMDEVRKRMGEDAYLRAFEAGTNLPTDATLASLLDDTN